MFITNTLRPGLIKGFYPEKNYPDQGWVERAYKSTSSIFNRKIFNSGIRSRRFVSEVNMLGDTYNNFTDEKITESIMELRHRLLINGFNEKTISHCFALIREIASRTIKQRHFDVQLIGGWAMLQGVIAEMQTGEGKTLTATLPACTAALAGIPVHIITVNEYLARRDAENMKPIYQAMGLSVAVVTEDMDLESRHAAYMSDITYCTNKQIAFDYLRDRIVLGNQSGRLQLQLKQLVKKSSIMNKLLLRGLYFAIVDEADSVFIDEAITPLIISKKTDASEQQKIFHQAFDIANQLIDGKDYSVNYLERIIELKDGGKFRIKELSRDFGSIWASQQRSYELVTKALSAQYLFIKDKHYLVQDNKVKIIDEFTGRVMADRSWESGLHQMIETKEACPISSYNETIARISYQKFFRRYLHLSGMTGTAREVASELWSVYHLKVFTVPTNRPVKRKQYKTKIYLTADAKWNAIIDQIVDLHKKDRPVLIGTRSVADSELLSNLLSKKNLPHNTLNARQDAQEAAIIKDAGEKGQITVATNMAGRGTDIKINNNINKLGGLHVIASERHESHRIDRQLFGRCGRQGDAGSYQFFLSCEDELIRLFCPEVILNLIGGFRVFGVRILNISYGILFMLAQKAAERHHAKIRTNLLKIESQLNKLMAFSGKSE